MSKGWWQTIAVLSLSVSGLLASVVLYALLAYGSNLHEVAKGQAICLAGSRAYDSIAAAQMIGRLDLVSFLLTAGGLLLATFTLFGFWTIRREAIDEARRVAAEEARTIAQKYYGLEENETRTYLSSEGAISPSTKNARVNRENSRNPDFDPMTVSTAGAVKEEPGAVNESEGGLGRDSASSGSQSSDSNGSTGQ